MPHPDRLLLQQADGNGPGRCHRFLWAPAAAVAAATEYHAAIDGLEIAIRAVN